MGYSIVTSPFSFISFDGEDIVSGCGYPAFRMCLPVINDDDIAFQFWIVTDTKAEADALCDKANAQVTVGLVHDCIDANYAVQFSGKPARSRLNDNTVCFDWSYLPNFGQYISVDSCFYIRVKVMGTTSFCSNCFVRKLSDCYSAVLAYSNDDDAFGFSYCGGDVIGASTDTPCVPLFVPFSNQSTLAIGYSTSLQDKYGPIPNVTVWLYNGLGELVNSGLQVKFDTYPATLISIDLGGPASGVVKIS